MKQVTATNEPDTPKKKYWVGYNTKPPQIQRQSKYDPDLLSLPEDIMIAEEGDRDPYIDGDRYNVTQDNQQSHR